MTATDTRIPLARAEELADDIVALLRPQCNRIAVAGSIRRRKPLVKDIEIVASPLIELTAVDLFGTLHDETDMLHAACDRLLADGTVAQRLDVNGRPRWGKRLKLLSYQGVSVDLFAVMPPASWGVIYAIRTGSAEFSHRFVTAKSIGGALPPYMLVRDGCLYRHIQGMDLPVDKEMRRQYPAGWLVEVPTPTEESFFEAIGMDWVEPEARV